MPVPRLLLPLALVLLLSTAPAEAGLFGRRPVTLGIVGDQSYSSDLQRSYAVLEQGVELLAGREEVEAVLHVGDLVESTQAPEEVRTRFGQAAAILDRLPVPWYLTAGDHDVNPPGFAPGSSDRSREALFQELYGTRVPAFRERPWYSFDVRGVHVVALYSHQTLHTDPRWGDIFLARIREDQLDWLRSDLEAHRRARAVVVFLHQPLWYHWSGWQRVHALLRHYPGAAVVAGHFHYDQDEGEIDGIRYLVVGTTGGDHKEGSRDAGDAHHVTLLRVDRPGRVEVELLPVGGGGPLPITPREDMDRVQALDVQLGSLWGFAAKNPVFLEGGRLVASCGGPPARVRIGGLGNPLDVPVTVQIDFRSEPAGIALAAPGFGAGLCRETEGGSRCALAPAARTAIANYSSVESGCPAGDCPSLWEAGLDAGRPPAPGTALLFDVRTSFSGASGELFLERTLRIDVASCPLP